MANLEALSPWTQPVEEVLLDDLDSVTAGTMLYSDIVPLAIGSIKKGPDLVLENFVE